jgi:hypothetical protein
MGRRIVAVSLAAGALFTVDLGRARAADTVVPAGMELTLAADLVLGAADSFTAGDASGARCKIHGAGHKIVSPVGGTWTGAFTMTNCDVDGLGIARDTAIGLDGGAGVTIVGSTFSKSSEISLVLRGAMAVTIKGNRIDKDSVVDNVFTSLDMSQNTFTVKGESTGAKVFQGNIVRKGRIAFLNTGDWQIGGLAPGEGNILAGERTGIFIDRSGAMTVQGNYSSTLGRGGNQVKNLNVFSPGGGPLIAEHNVFIGMAWNVEINVSGELRYNLIANPVERAWVQAWSAGGPKIHHNVLVQTKESQADMMGGGFVVFPGDNSGRMPSEIPPAAIEIYNNTLDAGGTCNPGVAGAVDVGGFLTSLRSNAFTNVRLPQWTGIALVGTHERTIPNPLPPMMGYADYNLFHNPDASVKANYNVGVEGKQLRVDPGFALNDADMGGAPNQQVDPKFAGPIPRSFPFDDEMVAAGAVSVCQILAFYRAAYAPGAGSPLTDKGDPQEGAGNDIGAIGAGAPNDLDKFGTLCAAGTFTPLAGDPKIYTCPSKPIGGGGNPYSPGGGTDGPPEGITCVCDASAGASGTTGALTAFALAALTLVTRRRARSR